MKITLFMAMSLNGIIARENGDEDFLSDKNWKTFKELSKKSGCLIIGRKTYEAVSKWEDHGFEELKNTEIIIVSKNSTNIQGKMIAKSAKEAIEKAKQKEYSNVLLAGGGITNTSFIKNNLIDEIIINIEPAILGKGIKLFSEGSFEEKLKLIKTKNIKDIVQLHYKVLK